jgi:hypothetical protein
MSAPPVPFARPRRRASLAAIVSLGSLGLSSFAPTLAASARAPVSRPRAAFAAAAGRLQVTEVEYRLLLSHAAIKAGAVGLGELDRGSVPHDLRLRREGGGPTISGKLLAPGKRWEGVVHLQPGVYKLWCSLPEHASLGMHTTLRVSR